jgi:DNA repair exonuclease SbcCD ATPase subunit
MSYIEYLKDNLGKCENSENLYGYGLFLIDSLERSENNLQKAEIELGKQIFLSEKYERLYKKAIAQIIRLRNRLRGDPSGTAKTWDWKHWRASILRVCEKAESDLEKTKAELETCKSLLADAETAVEMGDSYMSELEDELRELKSRVSQINRLLWQKIL